MEKSISLNEAFKLALKLHTQGKLDEAKKIYEKILVAKPDHFLSLSNIGIIYSQLKEFNKAIETFNNTIKVNPKFAEAYNNLGIVFYELNDLEKALKSFEEAIKIKSNFSDAFNNIGNVYQKKNYINKAIENYEIAILKNEGSNKDKPLFNLGNIFREQEDYEKSIDYYKKAIAINPNSIDASINLSISLNKTGKLKEAIILCENILKKDPKNTQALNNLGEYNQEIGDEKLSIDYYKKALTYEPDNLRSLWLMMNTFPVIYKDENEIKISESHFEKNLLLIENILKKDKVFNKDKVLNALCASTNFYLHYNGKDITDLQKRYGNILTSFTKSIYPKYHLNIETTNSNKPIKIGFVSSFFCEHVVTKLFKNLITKINKNKFNTFVYNLGFNVDSVTDEIKNNSNNFLQEANLDKLIDKIFSDKLDVLIYLDIGMVPKMQILASLRLAKIQCCAYGVPVTTGLKNIDYFLSSENMEEEFAQDHYSEKLIKLPKLGVDYDVPENIKLKDLSDKSNKEKTIFLVLQSNYKLLPQHDHVYIDIINQNRNCKIWFLTSKNDFVSKKFEDRLSLACKKSNFLPEDHLVFYPQASYQDYLNLIYKADIILDSFDWSGLNTSIDALNLNKPLITSPSKFMRGKHTCALLQNLKLEELICSTKEEYINLAIKLSKNSNYRDSISSKIKENKKIIFNDTCSVEFLENFFISLFNK